MSQKEHNPDDFKVVTFHNKTDFTFTPEMGCMYDGRPVSGRTGAPGIDGGESVVMSYHMGKRLAENLAKIVLLRGSSDTPTLDAQGNPMIKALWSPEKLSELAGTFITEMYSEQKQVAKTDTDRMFERLEEYKELTRRMEVAAAQLGAVSPQPNTEESITTPDVTGYMDKAEIIEELKKRGIAFDARQKRDELAKLLA
jgi:hypothetical protein